jgi:hypothetical protein
VMAFIAQKNYQRTDHQTPRPDAQVFSSIIQISTMSESSRSFLLHAFLCCLSAMFVCDIFIEDEKTKKNEIVLQNKSC